MKEQGMAASVEFNIDDLMDKEFYTYRKTKNFDERIYFRWNMLNLVTKHYTR
jgi:hypothetical protein